MILIVNIILWRNVYSVPEIMLVLTEILVDWKGLNKGLSNDQIQKIDKWISFPPLRNIYIYLVQKFSLLETDSSKIGEILLVSLKEFSERSMCYLWNWRYWKSLGCQH